MPLHLGILVGLRSEARLLEKCLPDPANIRVTLLLSTAKPAVAEAQAVRLVEAGATHLLSFGFAGGLDPVLASGTLLLPAEVIDEEGRVYPVDGAWYEQARAILAPLSPVTTRLVGTDSAIATAAGKSQLHRASRAAAVDMESHHLARAAAGRPLLVVRAILDTADSALPAAAMAAVGPDGGTDLFGFIGALLRRPQDVPTLVRLGRANAKAEAALLRGVGLGGFRGFGMT